MILANDFSSGLIRFQKLLAQMANKVLLDLARAVISSSLVSHFLSDAKFIKMSEKKNVPSFGISLKRMYISSF